MPANAMITYEGDVFWPIPTKLQSTCKIDITYFPFDEQLCRLKFGSWTYDGFQVDMTNRTVDVDLSNYVQNGEWELLAIRIERNVVYYLCCKEPFPDVTFIIHIRRRIIYYIYNIIFPCVMMSMLTLLVFCLPPESSEKVTMGITVLLAFSVFLLRMGEDLPETSEFIPLLSIYLTIVMSMTSVSVILTVFVLNLHYSNPNQKRVPRWLRKIFVRHKGNRRPLFDADKEYYTDVDVDTDDVDDYYTESADRHFVKNASLRLTIESLAKDLKEDLDEDNTQSIFNELSPSSKENEWTTNCRRPDNSDDRRQRRVDVQPSTNNVGTPTANLRTSEQILEALKTVIRRYERDDIQEFIVHEWRQVAVGVDRILFWIFLVGTVTSTIMILVVSPLTKWF
ncbi:hypothetical protein LSH36_223g04042 [Paralvinella palmiformis]|uniref:Uncharacterized protein n=1 Tax=Paralvinella palmiformis TaxID=53620 RepID=A0AAD9N5S7_9ANNE|nr:hypothetical protein LSH36_223g04042 [Paralvinella palmiformis]